MLVMLVGALLLALNGLYVGYVAYARNQIGDITVQRPSAIPAGVAVQPEAQGPAPSSIPRQPLPVYGEDEPRLDEVPEEFLRPPGFRPVTPQDLLAYGAAPPTRVRIPAIELDADIAGLRILDLGDARAYETPKNVVGHIPESANPGASGNVWLFGHLESPIRGEGSVFRNLPELYGVLQEVYDVYVIIDSAEGTFLYQVSDFRKIHRSQLSLYESEQPVVTLVTCWPRFKYDERILVTASLVGIAGPPPAA
jgi:LPXTG-site transpeptidase (sortase) family protein